MIKLVRVENTFMKVIKKFPTMYNSGKVCLAMALVSLIEWPAWLKEKEYMTVEM